MSAVKTKKGKANRTKEQYWPMQSGGPYSKSDGDGQEIYKCTGCGAETAPANGWNGAPDKHRCKPGCPCHASDWKPGRLSPAYRKNFDRIYPNAPGAGL